MAKRILIFIIMSLLGAFASAQQIEKQNGNSKEYFLNEFPKIVCLEDDYLMSCYQIKKSQCEFQVKELVETCWEKIPKKNKTTSKLITLGSCVGNLFEKKNINLKSNDTQCSTVQKWN